MIEQGGGEEYGKDFQIFVLIILYVLLWYVCMQSWESESKIEPVLCILRWSIDIFCCQVLNGSNTNWVG